MVLANYCDLLATNSSGFKLKNMMGNNTLDNIAGLSDTATNVNQRLFVLAGTSGSYGNYGQGKVWLDVGYGETAETPSDYRLADGNISNTLLTATASGVNTHAASPTQRMFFSVYTTFQNNGNSDVIVKEVGVYGNPSTNGYAYNTNTVLLCRKVLDNPITIAPGESYNFTYQLKIKDN